jgi:hypothetical protein
VDLSAKVVRKVVRGDVFNSLERRLTISGELRVLDTNGLVTMESELPWILKVSDEHGNAVPCQFEQ